MMAPARIDEAEGPSRQMLLDLAAASAEGFHLLSLPAAGGKTEVAGVGCWYSASYVPVFNGAGLFSEQLLDSSTLAAVESYYAARQRPYSLVTVDGLVDRTGERLRSLGYLEYDSSPAMWLEGSPHCDRFAGVRVAEVVTLADLGAFRTILGRVFSIPPSELNLLMGANALEMRGVRNYLAWLGSSAVGTASLVLSGPVAGVWNVGTLLEYRRQGVATALMQHIVAAALENGYTSTMLLASAEGLRLYEQLGYSTVSMVRVFVKRKT